MLERMTTELSKRRTNKIWSGDEISLWVLRAKTKNKKFLSLLLRVTSNNTNRVFISISTSGNAKAHNYCLGRIELWSGIDVCREYLAGLWKTACWWGIEASNRRTLSQPRGSTTLIQNDSIQLLNGKITGAANRSWNGASLPNQSLFRLWMRSSENLVWLFFSFAALQHPLVLHSSLWCIWVSSQESTQFLNLMKQKPWILAPGSKLSSPTREKRCSAQSTKPQRPIGCSFRWRAS